MRVYENADYSQVSKWCFLRDISAPPKWSIPETGLIVDDVAVAFLIVTNNHIGILDFFISNPLSDKHMRNRALERMSIALIELAADMHLKQILCNSQHPAMKERAIRHGFDFVGEFSCFQKGL